MPTVVSYQWCLSFQLSIFQFGHFGGLLTRRSNQTQATSTLGREPFRWFDDVEVAKSLGKHGSIKTCNCDMDCGKIQGIYKQIYTNNGVLRKHMKCSSCNSSFQWQENHLKFEGCKQLPWSMLPWRTNLKEKQQVQALAIHLYPFQRINSRQCRIFTRSVQFSLGHSKIYWLIKNSLGVPHGLCRKATQKFLVSKNPRELYKNK